MLADQGEVFFFRKKGNLYPRNTDFLVRQLQRFFSGGSLWVINIYWFTTSI